MPPRPAAAPPTPAPATSPPAPRTTARPAGREAACVSPPSAADAHRQYPHSRGRQRDGILPSIAHLRRPLRPRPAPPRPRHQRHVSPPRAPARARPFRPRPPDAVGPAADPALVPVPEVEQLHAHRRAARPHRGPEHEGVREQPELRLRTPSPSPPPPPPSSRQSPAAGAAVRGGHAVGGPAGPRRPRTHLGGEGEACGEEGGGEGGMEGGRAGGWEEVRSGRR